jgi:tetratricopeptide (TPR) repeat protein
MSETPASPESASAWVGPEAPCVFCGHVIPRSADRCPQCRTSFSIAVRKASREIIGPWYYLDPRNPSGRGVMLETLLKMIEKGRLRPDSIVRGPTTHQDWMYAAETPRLAKYFGMCPHCFGEAKPEETFCTHCQLNMNTRPADARPGIPPYLVKPPVHRAAYETEMQLVGAEPEGQGESLGDEALVAPVAAVGPLPPPEEPEPAPVAKAAPPAPTPAAAHEPSAPPSPPASTVPVELAAALSEKRSGTPMPLRRKRPMVGATLLLTCVALGALGLLAYKFWPGEAATNPEGPSPEKAAIEAWLNHQLAQVTEAEQAGNYPKAIERLQYIVEKTQDPATIEAMKGRIRDIQGKIKRADEEKRAALTKLGVRLKQAQDLADKQDFENALAALNNIGEEDRKALLALNNGKGVSVASMEAEIHAKQDKWNADQKRLKEQEEALDAQIELARTAEKDGKLKEALEQYKRLPGTFPADMVAKRVNVQAKVTDLETKLAAAPPVVEPTKEPVKAKPVTPGDIGKEVADISEQAAALEKQEKFEQARLKLEEIMRNYEEKYWPEKLKERIKQLKDREEALKFFGIGGTKK